ncbi:hypothetical protein [Ramlibacter sp.]|uniref:hypothetical protein n=1 Tax=Ramlibacter sp. TaxID=1917967 RepID=UPI00260EFF51|nr:hypothetical protein [Ramlibacter sp.]
MRVPTVDGPSVAEQPLPAVRESSVASGDLLGASARQMGAFGDAALNLGVKINQELAVTAAKDADIRFAQGLTDRLFNPETGYMVRKGRDAVDAYQGTVEGIQTLQRQILDGVNDPVARKMAQQSFAQRANEAIHTLSRHADTETREWKLQTSESRATTSILTAANDPSNPEAFISGLSTAMHEAEAQGKIHGWDPETTAVQTQKYVDYAYEQRYTSWGGKDPVAALTHFATSGGARMTPLARENIRNKLFQQAAPVLADELNATGGAGVLPTAPPAPDGTPAAQAPRGIRNNNPGNIVKTDRPWQGEMLGNDPRYSSFDTPEAGIRALAKTLTTYGEKYGLNTVQSIIARWAPASENDTGAYVNAVAGQLGVGPTQPLDLKNPATMSGLVQAIVKHENGTQPYSDEQIAHGIGAAGNAAGTPANLPAPTALRGYAGPTGHPLIDVLPPAERERVVQMARTQGAQAMAEAREQLKGRVQDTQAEYLATGTASHPPAEADFIRAYGQGEGPQRYRELQDVAALGRQVQQVRNLPAVQIDQMLQQAKPPIGDGFALHERNYEVLTRAAQQVVDARQKDPVDYALRSGMYNIKPLTSLEPQALSAEMPRRAAAAARISADYGTPVSLLTVPEAKAMSAQLKAAPVEAQKQILGALSTSVGDIDLYKRTMQAIAPDNPVIAMAGVHQAQQHTLTDGRDVADLMLRGQAILTPNTKTDGSGHEGGRSLVKMPEEKLMLSDFNAVTGDAFKGREQAADLFYQGAKAIYAARSAEDGDYSGVIDSRRWKSAIQLATGGVQSHNGSKIVMPYGMTYDTFQNTLADRTTQLAQTSPPLNASAPDLLRLPLENYGDGKYLFRRGAGYVVDQNGRPLIVDVNPRAGESGGKPAFTGESSQAVPRAPRQRQSTLGVPTNAGGAAFVYPRP